MSSEKFGFVPAACFVDSFSKFRFLDGSNWNSTSMFIFNDSAPYVALLGRKPLKLIFSKEKAQKHLCKQCYFANVTDNTPHTLFVKLLRYI